MCNLLHSSYSEHIYSREQQKENYTEFAFLHKHSTLLTVHGCLTSPPHLPFVSLAARQLAARSLLGWGLLPLQWDLIHENSHRSDVRDCE